ncbi:MAG: SUMF1/EgtB/PvdO family nonheme iron enzyme [Thiothrix sp.]|uniref:SUMF1/EgtB/PvdO family nonheme iron enzyme n=1 Tax=Thiothrix sp. TaxID=1032 RepID=UPI00261A0830|nr:SUMF1/EgtB/PvdO family nonheme iron enzyme [Thiothrix sp.]MDD5394710.1 SUMF1/EgtB/PvdO family nonheme iron enzyme [Thiothrix sp.]
MHDIFLSYSTQDRERLQRLFHALEQQGWSVFWDHRTIEIGDHWSQKIDRAIRSCKCVVVVWSKASVNSEWVLEEANIGKQRKILLPIQIDAVDIPVGFTMRQTGNFARWDGKTDHPEFVRLAEKISELVGKPFDPPPQPQPQRQPQYVAAKLPTKSRKGLVLTSIAAISLAVGATIYVKQHPVQPLEPEMVNIPAGTFTMGCDPKRDDVEGGCYGDEKPAHEVSIRAFQLAATDVTFEQWDACEKAKACPHAEDSGWGRGNRPVINVSWNDAQTYLQWLGKESGKNYRLPTEAEWEYAARAGTSTAYAWGNSIGKNNANCDGCGSQWDNKQTSPVRSFAANPFGLYDMNGNVLQWVEDCYVDSYKDAPAAGTPVKGCDANASRVLRGGSWGNLPLGLRSADRYYGPPGNRSYYFGFRAARTL